MEFDLKTYLALSEGRHDMLCSLTHLFSADDLNVLTILTQISDMFQSIGELQEARRWQLEACMFRDKMKPIGRGSTDGPTKN